MLVGDIESAGMSGIVTREVAERIARALPATAEVLLVHGPDLIGTLVPDSALEARLAHGLPQSPIGSELRSGCRSTVPGSGHQGTTCSKTGYLTRSPPL